MSKVLILYYSTYGHLEKLAAAVAAGAREVAATVDIRRVPETTPRDELLGHQLLGSDTLRLVKPALRTALDEIDTWEEVSRSTDFKRP